MTIEPHIEQRPAQPYVAIPIQLNLTRWHEANALVPKLYAWIAEHGHTPAGGPTYRYRTIGDDVQLFDLDVAVRTMNLATGDDAVHAGAFPAGEYLVTVHEGHPDQQVRTHEALQDWAANNGIALASTVGSDRRTVWTTRCETYLTNPAEEPDPSKWRTEISYLTDSEG